jgi:uncharacterized protein (TIGR00730 family)
MQRICVFAGSNSGTRQEYTQAATDLGQELAHRNLGLVYGGASVGLMGTLADSILAGGGEAIGVIPHSLIRKEVEHSGLSELRVVETMHERKAMMADLADGFIALPGGFGTFDELFEILTWAQLSFHQKPIGLLDIAGYFTPLLSFVQHVSKEGFIRPEHLGLLLHDTEPGSLLEQFAHYTPVSLSKWNELPPR